MDNWQEVKLGDVCNIFTGKKDVNQTDENGKYIFFSCSPKEFRSNEYLYDGKAIIVAGNGSYTGRVRFFNGKFDLYQRTYACVQKNSMNNINMSFIYYVMKGKFEPKYLGGTRGSSIPYIVMGDLSNFPISLPPLEVQKKIAGVLGALDD
ncbi:MAG: restriction endonuclease subunit S, partial [Alphaproteobacteria bacterium]